MRAKTTPDPRHRGHLARFAAVTVALTISGCFVDEAPESSEGGSTAPTDPSMTGPTTESMTGSTSPTTSATADTNTGSTTNVSDSASTTATSENTTATSETTGATSNTATDSDPTTDPTATSTTGVDKCLNPELELAMTSACTEGTKLISAEIGHESCASEFGEAWRWLEFHDGEAIGWTAYGTWQSPVGAGERGWVWIDDNTGQCWTSTHGMTWFRPEGDSCKAACAPDTGLEEPGFDPLPGKCNPYDGDTPCDLCRRLICVRG